MFKLGESIKASCIKKGLKAMDIACPLCRYKDWEIIGNIEGAGNFIDMENPEYKGTIIPVVKILCKGCGFVAHFDARLLQKFAASEKE